MYSLLRDECKKYDEGDSRYILNIVGKLYILLDDSGSQKSVLRQLGVRNKIMFPDSCSLHDKRSILPPLVDVHVSPLASERLIFAAKLNACHAAERVVYGKWWNGVLYETKNELRLKRREIIAIMRSQDGHGGLF
jgi:hypothetical protein